MRRTEAPNRISSPFVTSEASREAAREFSRLRSSNGKWKACSQAGKTDGAICLEILLFLCFRVIGQHFPLFSNVFYSAKTTVKYQG